MMRRKDAARFREKINRLIEELDEVQAHVSQADWLPDVVPALYQKIEGGSGV